MTFPAGMHGNFHRLKGERDGLPRTAVSSRSAAITPPLLNLTDGVTGECLPAMPDAPISGWCDENSVTVHGLYGT